MNRKGGLFTSVIISLLTIPTSLLALGTNKDVKSGIEKIVSAKQDLKPFNAVSFSGLGNLHITQTDQQSFTIEAEESILPMVKVYVKDKTLYIDFKGSSDNGPTKLDYYLNIKDLQKIDSFGSSTVFMTEGFESDTLSLSFNSFGEAKIKLKVKQLNAQIGGGSKVDAEGIAINQDIQISGAGEFNGSKLSGDKATVSISGPGIARTNVSDDLGVKMTGEGGELEYCEKPTLTKDISGSGVVSPAAESECE